MTGRVEGKVAFITGAARGQGRAHAVRLAEEGADIIAIDIAAPIPTVEYPAATPGDLDETARLVEKTGRRILTAIVDTRDVAGLARALGDGVARFGRLDIVVANAGINVITPLDKVTEAVWDETIGINLTGTWNTVKVSIPHLIAAGGGSVVLTSSVAGLKGLPFMLPYVASKSGVTGMAEALAHELAQWKIRVNSLHPGGVDSAMGDPKATEAFGPALENNPGVGGMLITSTDDALTQPSDQSNAVLFLVSDEAKYVTAQHLAVDAGASTY